MAHPSSDLTSVQPSTVSNKTTDSTSSASLCAQHFIYLVQSDLHKKLFLYKFIYFIYLFLVVLGFHCCTQAFSSCSKWGLLFIAVRVFLIAVASLVVEHGF